ncbi:MAG: acyl-ACP--UDP-N-acetylglucosamine O-acyltransferase [Vicinamibacteria bacterium]
MPAHPTAVVAPGARLAASVEVGPYAVVEPDVVIGEGTTLRAHAVVKRFTRLGSGNAVHEHAILGGEPQDLSFEGAPSRLLIGDRNVIREGVTIHRASHPGGATVVGSDCFLMAYVHVAHEDVIGDRVIMANNVALAGHVTIGERAFLSGGVVVHQFCRVGRLAMIGGNSKVIKDCLPFVITDGLPARARGLNVVGLRRAGFTASQLRTLKEAYRLLLRSGLRKDDALERLRALHDPLADELAEFAAAGTRGFHASGRHAEAD